LPTTYAHYRFGREALSRMPEDLQQLIRVHLDLFNFGVHGPDLLFYYRALQQTAVNRTGYLCHDMTGRAFFTRSLQTVRDAEKPDEARAYLFGVLCHFALDRCCHPYIGRKEQEGVSHSLIESSFDRYLMLLDGLDPVTHKVTAHLHPGKASAAVIAPFYPPVTAGEVLGAQRQMVFYLNALVAKGPKRRALSAAMRLAGKPGMQDMFVPYTRAENCIDSDEIIFGHYGEALELMEQLVPELSAALEGADSLGPGFDHTFGVD